jgi:hypothetical protein
MHASLTALVPKVIAAVVMGSVVTLAGCASTGGSNGPSTTQASADPRNDKQTCQSYGLTPGTNAYQQCVYQGASGYAATHRINSSK